MASALCTSATPVSLSLLSLNSSPGWCLCTLLFTTECFTLPPAKEVPESESECGERKDKSKRNESLR